MTMIIHAVDIRPRWLGRAFIMIAAIAALGLSVSALHSHAPADNTPPNVTAVAVLGDSSSHSYQDRLSFPPGTSDRGGALRARTFQWTEVLARLRGGELNFGPWVRWGQSSPITWLIGLVGQDAGRTPRKEDYLYNFAISGATCRDLMNGRFRRYPQAPRLVELMNADPWRWRNGVVVLRMGNNDWGAVLDEQARDPKAPEVRSVAAYCADQLAATIKLIRDAHPDTRILVVGLDNGANDASAPERYSAVSLANVQAAFVGFNAQLRGLAASDERIAFFDNGVWFESLWGRRVAGGSATYKSVTIGAKLRVTNTVGDEPTNAELADHHAGLAWNALWAQALVARLREAFDLPLTPISDDEVARFVIAP
ncbi:hypothetical protein SAMN05428997_12472 [Bosea sp. CRIB-10]|uniref:SGNH/GDSL hydrolase family protein n=1 Tax=Bosea sp. CRIB-10 TaxID=378404 RepID=UPI0008E09621|nr:SGNH/GDSL hydrolase family protein [Bosea sp. CRIB-10]SFD32143.1 hypothetical protein SAMN05428997_12472 [Bosea sp. CRIB-10]